MKEYEREAERHRSLEAVVVGPVLEAFFKIHCRLHSQGRAAGVGGSRKIAKVRLIIWCPLRVFGPNCLDFRLTVTLVWRIIHKSSEPFRPKDGGWF
jgi:hypothetical protein